MDVRAMWDFDQPEVSERLFLDAADRADEPQRTVLITQAARAVGLQHRFDEAHQLLDAVSTSEQQDLECAARISLERGRLLRSADHAEESQQHFERARDLTAGQVDTEPLGGVHVDALHMLAMLPSDPAEQVSQLTEAVRLAESSEDPTARDWRASLFNNLGMSQHDAGDLAGALVSFQRAQELREDAGDRRGTQVARWMVAWTLRLLGRTAEARGMQLALKADLDADGIDDRYVIEELTLLDPALDAVQPG